VGTHTLTATARDNAGNTTADTRTYTVRPWTLRGFYDPVKMHGQWNRGRGGSAVPLKFEVFQGRHALTGTTAISTFTQQKVSLQHSCRDRVSTPRRQYRWRAAALLPVLRAELEDAEGARNLLPGHHDHAGQLDAHRLVQTELELNLSAPTFGLSQGLPSAATHSHPAVASSNRLIPL
jgi:hypothetical protein